MEERIGERDKGTVGEGGGSERGREVVTENGGFIYLFF